ncbi:MAG: hypothetical protein JO269_11475 [Burkholderiaceae bacterium]|nr:hypothetical protein [Burkholderiaceae bacterium]
MQPLYLNAHQSRKRAPTSFEDLLGDAIERAFAAGVEDVATLVAHLNATGPNSPEGTWTVENYQALVARLAAEC